MKKTFFLFTAAILAMSAISCTKQLSSAASTPVAPEPTGSIRVTIDTEETKIASTRDGESEVRSLQVFVFDKDGKLETDKYDDKGAKELTLTTLTGDKHIWALVNAPRQNLVKDTPESSFAQTVSYLSDNLFSTSKEQCGLVMVGAYGATHIPGSQQGALNPEFKEIPAYAVGSDTPEAVAINVYRLGARISLAKVTVNFSESSLKGATFKIHDIYLKNVVNGLKIDGTATDLTSNANFWTNCMTDHETSSNHNGNFYIDGGATSRHEDLKYLLCDKNINLGPVTTSGAITVNRDWYVYPNPTTGDSSASTWAARYTRLVLHAVVNANDNDIHTYYVFPIPPVSGATTTPKTFDRILSNHTYDISNITITMLGKDNDDSDELSETGKAKITITVSGWTQNYTVTYEI